VIFATSTKGEVRAAAVETLRSLQQALLSLSVPEEKLRARTRTTGDDRGGNSGLGSSSGPGSGCGSGSSISVIAGAGAGTGGHNKDSDRLMYTWIQDLARQEEIKKLTL
jgi:hypothetical protein